MTENSATSLRMSMRKLWSDHVIWTRFYVIAAIAGSPLGGAISLAGPGDAAAVRLLKNQEDIGNAIVPFYGEAAGKQLTDLLKEHIMIAVDLVAAAVAGDEKKF